MPRVVVDGEVFDLPEGTLPVPRFRSLVQASEDEEVYEVTPDGFRVLDREGEVPVRDGATYGKVLRFTAAGHCGGGKVSTEARRAGPMPSFARLIPPGAALPALREAVATSLAERACRQVLAPCRRRGLAGVEPLGFLPLFEEIRLVEGRNCDWLVFPMEADPLYKSGRFPVPRRTLRHLRAVDAAEASFDALYIAHELPKGLIRQGDEVAVWRALAPPPPKALVELSARLGRASLGALLAAFGAPFVAGGGLALGAAVAAAPALTVLDPIILGAVGARRPAQAGDPAYFFLLAAWRWG